MRPILVACVLAMAVSVTSCGEGGSTEPPPKPKPIDSKTILPTNVPTSTSKEKAPDAAQTSKPPAPAVNTAPVLMWICPETGCKGPLSPKGGACAKHTKVEKVEQLYTCSKCSSEEVVPGKCSGCSDTLVPTVKR